MSQNVVCCSEFAILVSLYRTKGSLICTAMPYPLTCFVAAPTDSKFNASRTQLCVTTSEGSISQFCEPYIG
ncbi:uncharacterized protein PHALS_01718 [Plasmopara halstedii]|uniref:Uncharacterized protein n=1 Tax=Plasmopara halstedii TaxID=4781 RepID=A0A0P1AWE7_PLAHL|nr:uncharacterized protein PHALS_01718 [Plasmopara halstedii]CEG45421.1 hypothetical protein PHALS_01718 [Plasmopara halstedii]|eukprot:XP_024581790.1 hypothetical protein PHALS_01718 [Plasmopara halstedii]